MDTVPYQAAELISCFFSFANKINDHMEKFLGGIDKYSIISSTGLTEIELDNPLKKDSDTDTDSDGLTDWEEVNVPLIHRTMIKNNKDIGSQSEILYENFPTFGEMAGVYFDLFYVEEGLQILENSENSDSIEDIRILPITSDPTSVDGDEDGINDNEDPLKLKYGISKRLSINDKESLIINLKNYADEYDSLHNIKKFTGGFSLEKCVDILYFYDEFITEMSNKYMLPKEFIQTVMFRELRCYYLQDNLADILVINK